VVRQIRRDFPDRDIVLSVGSMPGANRKVANLCHMMWHARHDILVVSDSDIRVRSDYLRAMFGALVDPAAAPAIGLPRGPYGGPARDALGLPVAPRDRREPAGLGGLRVGARRPSRGARRRAPAPRRARNAALALARPREGPLQLAHVGGRVPRQPGALERAAAPRPARRARRVS